MLETSEGVRQLTVSVRLFCVGVQLLRRFCLVDMAIIRTKRFSHFTTIPNELINDSRLAWKELGLLVYLLSKPDTWSVRVDVLVKERQIGRDAVYMMLKKLREAGYAKLIKYSNGSTEWTILDKRSEENPNQDNPDKAYPNPENPDQENPDQDNPHVLVKTDIKKILSNSKKTLTLSEFLIQCKTKNELPIPENDSVFEYANKVGIPIDFLNLAWVEFKKVQREDKKQASWRQTFRNYVSKNYLKLWFIDNEGNYVLTTSGKQLQREVA